MFYKAADYVNLGFLNIVNGTHTLNETNDRARGKICQEIIGCNF